MKTKIIVLFLTALFLSACSSSYLAKSGNDDLYYTPGKVNSATQTQTTGSNDVPKPSTAASAKNTSGKMSDYERYRKALENGEITDTSKTYANNSSVQNAADSKEPEVESNDYYGNGGNSYVYDDYYYAYRINRFHGGFYHPYFYDPFYYNSFYDPFYYSPGWSFSIGFGWGYPYYSSYYYPYYGGYWGFYGYQPYYGYYPYHNHYGYYDGYYGGSYYGNGRYYNRGYNLRSASSTSYRTYPARATNTERSGIYNGRSTRSFDGQTSGRTVNRGDGSMSDSRNARTYTRRLSSDGAVVPSSRNGSSADNRQATTERRNYTPSYSKPRTYSRPVYNESSGSSGSDRRSSGSYSGSRSGSYSGSRSDSYSSGSSSRSYNSGSSYSGSSSSSSRSYSGGSSSSSGSSGGGSSSGGGGGSHSSGGRR